MTLAGIILTALGIIGAITSFTHDLILLGFLACTIATMGFFLVSASLETMEGDK